MAMGLLAILVPAEASAAITHNPAPFSPLDGSGSGVTIHEPSGIAVDETTGNVFTTDGTPFSAESEGVLILGGEGAAPAELAAPFVIEGVEFASRLPAGLAYDNSATSPNEGTLYVYDAATEKIKKYVRNPVTEHYELALGELSAPGAGQGVNATVGLGLDSAGNVYLGSFPASSIYKFNASGVQVAKYDLSATPADKPGQIAVDGAGDLFVQRQEGGVYKFPANGSGEIEPSVFTLVAAEPTTGVAYDRLTNHVYIPLKAGRVSEYDATSLAKVSEFGSGELGQPERIAVNSATERIYVTDVTNSDVAVFGPAVTVPTTNVGAATNVTGTKATLNGSVNPEGLAVTECFFEWGTKAEGFVNHTNCEALPPTDSAVHPVSADINGLEANGAIYEFRLVTRNANGFARSAIKTLTTAATVVTQPATAVGIASATLNGLVRPEGLQYTTCKFEYGLTTSVTLTSVPCVPGAAEIDPDFSPHSVSAAVSGLQANAAYRFRLTATNSAGTLTGEELTFTTNGPPVITEIRARDADQTSATVEAKVNPSNSGTSYHFEWGPNIAYGHSVPADFEPFIGTGSTAVLVTAKLSGLSPGTIYHYRIVAKSAAGTTASPDQEVETLNSCGLPDQRCFELVSPRNAGPVAIPVKKVGTSSEIRVQAATEGFGALAYGVEGGLPGATRGATVLYRATRGASGWNSSQLSPPVVARNESLESNSNSSVTVFLSENLGCGFVISMQTLTADPGTKLVAETGGGNLYRRNPDGTYTAVTTLPPTNPGASGGLPENQYQVLGASQDCSKVVFSTKYLYPGVPVVGSRPLYEWSQGTLRGVGVVPNGSGESNVEAIGGSGGNTASSGNHVNIVSRDGSRVFFTANKLVGSVPGEVGKAGVFVRESGAVTRDLSLTRTSAADVGATYQYAAADGSRVFFTANAGLTTKTSAKGTDLYEYNLKESTLTDLSVETDPGEEAAEVGGFLGASADGSHVYFAAQGQLVQGRGNTLSQNKAAGTDSVYSSFGSQLDYVGAVRSSELGIGASGGVATAEQKLWSSRVSPDGRYLVFETGANVTGYESGGPTAREAYLYDSAGSGKKTICLSCRQDGKPSVAVEPAIFRPLPSGGGTDPLYAPLSLVIRGGKPQVFFFSRDRLGPGATDGLFSLYEWSHGQVFDITTEPSGLTAIPGGSIPPTPNTENSVEFAGANMEGSDLYLASPQRLSWEDGDERFSVYDARIGGGFPQPPSPPSPCNSTVEGSCQGSPGAGPSVPSSATSTFTGPGNPKHKKTHHKKHKKHKKTHHKKHKKQKKKSKHKQQSKKKQTSNKRHATGNRRVGK
jgi:hypothetical protein